jgi:hypothetical protein
MLKDLNSKDIILSVEEYKSKRSLEQNRLYWGVYVLSLANEWKVEPEVAHEIIKREFNFKVVEVKGKNYKVGKSTSSLTVSKFSELLNKLEEYCNTNQITLFDIN